jgi:hypothetical protein
MPLQDIVRRIVRKDEESGGSDHAQNDQAVVVRKHFVAISGEFVGTAMFLFFAFAIHLVAVDLSGEGTNIQMIILISLAYGFSLLVCAWIWYRISGGLFNPAVRWTSAVFLNHCLRLAGYLRSGSCWGVTYCPGYFSLPSTDARCNRCCRTCGMYVSRRHQVCKYNARCWDIHCSRCLHRDVSD